MVPKVNCAVDSLYEISTSSLPVRFDFNKFNGFLGRIKSEFLGALPSVRVYRTNLCASVATKINFSGENWQKTPLITGLNSSLPVAKAVLSMADAMTSPFNFTELAPFNSGDFGKSAAF